MLCCTACVYSVQTSVVDYPPYTASEVWTAPRGKRERGVGRHQGIDAESMEQTGSGDATAADQEVSVAAEDQADTPSAVSDPPQPAVTGEGDGETSKPSLEAEGTKKTDEESCELPQSSEELTLENEKKDADKSSSSHVEMKATGESKDPEEGSGQTSESPKEMETTHETKETEEDAVEAPKSLSQAQTKASESSCESPSLGQNEGETEKAPTPPELEEPEEADKVMEAKPQSPSELQAPEEVEEDTNRTAEAHVEPEQPETPPKSSGVHLGSSGELEASRQSDEGANVNSSSPPSPDAQKTADASGEPVKSPANSGTPLEAAESSEVTPESSSVSVTRIEAEESGLVDPDSPSESGTAKPSAVESVAGSACPVSGETSEASPCRTEDQPGVEEPGKASSGAECVDAVSADKVAEEESMPVLEREEPTPEDTEVNASAQSEMAKDDEAPSLEEKREADDEGGDKGGSGLAGDASVDEAEKSADTGEVNFVISDVCTTQQFENGDDDADETAEGDNEMNLVIQNVCTAEDFEKAKDASAPAEVIDLSEDDDGSQKNTSTTGNVNNNSATNSLSNDKEPSGNGQESRCEDVEMKEVQHDGSTDKEAPPQSKSGDQQSSVPPSGREEEKMDTSAASTGTTEDDDDNDVIILDDKETMEAIDVDALDIPEVTPAVTMDPNNDTGLQITSVQGGADINKITVKLETASPKRRGRPPKNTQIAARVRNCLVCGKLVRCKYNIMHNGTARHLCDNTCFKAFRAKPAMYLGALTTKAAPSPHAPSFTVPAPASLRSLAPALPRSGQQVVPASEASQVGQVGQVIKTCRVCEVMNISSGTTKTFLNWQGFDFCSDTCLGKFQQMLGTSCYMCKTRLQSLRNPLHCVKAGQEMRVFCSQACQNSFASKRSCCASCSKDLSGVPDSFSAPVGPQSQFKEFCSQECMKQFDKSAARGQQMPTHCAVCNRTLSPTDKNKAFRVKLKGMLYLLCGSPCLDTFKFAQKVDLSCCDHCTILCNQDEAQLHFIQFEGQQRFFCSDACVGLFRQRNRKAVVCAFCNTQRQNFDMIERVDANSSFQLFCSLNCLSLYRVNLQAKSNQAVPCDQCRKRVPAQYHLTMSDASVRNFCSYGCVVSYQAQFSKLPATVPGTSPPQTPARVNVTPRQSPRQAARAVSNQTSMAASQQPSIPVISNVMSLAPQQGVPQPPTVNVNLQTSTGIPIVAKGPATPAIQTVGPAVQKTTTGSQAAPVQQQIIIQPPAPKSTRNKSLLCKPFVQTKATSCRPLATAKACQTDETGPQTVIVPVPVPIYVPIPLPMYAAPTPHPFPIPIPVPVPVFIPTTKKSADGILRHIKEISEKIPTDPLEAEMLMMAEAVAEHKESSSDSESDNELPAISFGEKADEGKLVGGAGKAEGPPVEEEDMLQMAMRMAEEMTEPMDLEAAVDPVPINTEPPPPRVAVEEEDEFIPVPETRKRAARRQTRPRTRSSKRQRVEPEVPAQEPTPPPPAIVAPPQPPADASCYLKKSSLRKRKCPSRKK